MMAVGLGRLRLAPDVFWAMTPKEYAAAVGSLMPGRSMPPPGRDDLMDLMAAYPDRIEEE